MAVEPPPPRQGPFQPLSPRSHHPLTATPCLLPPPWIVVATAAKGGAASATASNQCRRASPPVGGGSSRGHPLVLETNAVDRDQLVAARVGPGVRDGAGEQEVAGGERVGGSCRGRVERMPRRWTLMPQCAWAMGHRGEQSCWPRRLGRGRLEGGHTGVKEPQSRADCRQARRDCALPLPCQRRWLLSAMQSRGGSSAERGRGPPEDLAPSDSGRLSVPMVHQRSVPHSKLASA